MTEKEIIKALESHIAQECGDCPYNNDLLGPCITPLMEASLALINCQQEIITNISKLIVNNTYPGFDKNGKAVSIWNAEGYKQIEDMLKGGCKDVKRNNQSA